MATEQEKIARPARWRIARLVRRRAGETVSALLIGAAGLVTWSTSHGAEKPIAVASTAKPKASFLAKRTTPERSSNSMMTLDHHLVLSDFIGVVSVRSLVPDQSGFERIELDV